MNLFIMNYDEVINWYEPSNENEKYLLNLMKDFIKDYDADKISNLKSDIEDLENTITRMERKYDDSSCERDELENRISAYEYDIDELKDEIQTLNNYIRKIEEEFSK